MLYAFKVELVAIVLKALADSSW